MNRTEHPASFAQVIGLVLCLAVTLMALCSAPALATLPDNRAFEMVSPVEKGGQSLMANIALTDASGEHVIVDGGLHNSLLALGASWMLATRTPTGWNSVQVGPPPGREPGLQVNEEGFTYIGGVSEDFNRFLFQTEMSLNPRDPGAESGDMYVRDGATGPFEWASGPPAPEVKALGSQETNFHDNVFKTAVFSGASADLSDVVWNQFYPLVPPPGSLPGAPADTHAAGDEVYESVDGAAQLVGLVPAAGTECSPSQGSCVVPPCGAAMGNEAHQFAFATTTGAVSRAGSQVIFTSPDPTTEVEGVAGCGSPEVYVRADGTSSVQVSASQRAGGDPHGPKRKVYAGSVEEGGRVATVFFTSKEELANESNTGAADEGNDLYAYSLQTGTLTDLTPDESAQDLSGANVIQFVGAAADGSRVYFTARGVLAGANAEGRAPAEGESADNLYVYETASGRTTFIAPGGEVGGPPFGRESRGIGSELTPDGRHIVFRASENLTAYNQHGNAEVYLYDTLSEHLTCVSCNPTGAPPAGPATLPVRFKDGARIFGMEPGTLPSPKFVTDDGSRVFFNSPDQLTSEVVPTPRLETRTEILANGNELVPNAYEYEGGLPHLIAPEAGIVSITPSGHDAFINTFAQLTPQDTDGGPDIYDARIGGGFALAPPGCSGTSCQGVPAAPPIFATPSSVTFSGVGNFPPAAATVANPPAKPKPKAKKCRKGYVKKRGKCVRQHKANKASHGKGRK